MVRCRGGNSSRGWGDVSRGRRGCSRGGHNGGHGLVPSQGDRPRGDSSIFTSGRRTIIRGAFSGGSSSRGGSGDPIADMHGVLREQRSHVISNYGSDDYSEDANYGYVDHEVDGHEDDDHEDDTNHPSQHNSYVGDVLRNTSQGRSIKRASGEGFVNVHGDFHKSISRILREHRDGAWLTFKQVPKDEVACMYDRFRTRWTWDPTNEEAIYQGFINVTKRLFREITMQLRKKATKSAFNAEENFDPSDSNQFNIIRKYPPESILANMWRDMCLSWNTEAWLNKSKSGSSNRNNGDTSSRHTGGSMGFDEHRDNWVKTNLQFGTDHIIYLIIVIL